MGSENTPRFKPAGQGPEHGHHQAGLRSSPSGVHVPGPVAAPEKPPAKHFPFRRAPEGARGREAAERRAPREQEESRRRAARTVGRAFGGLPVFRLLPAPVLLLNEAFLSEVRPNTPAPGWSLQAGNAASEGGKRFPPQHLTWTPRPSGGHSVPDFVGWRSTCSRRGSENRCRMKGKGCQKQAGVPPTRLLFPGQSARSMVRALSSCGSTHCSKFCLVFVLLQV